MPLFSIIIPVYNRSLLVRDTVLSILLQRYNDFELILVDDGSTDDTATVIQSFTDLRIRYVYQENNERGAARNNGAKKASGDYLIFFDSDDIMYEHHLQMAADFIDANHRPPVFYHAYEVVNTKSGKKKIISRNSQRLKWKLAWDNFLACDSVVIRSDVFREFWFNEERVLATAEDKELWLRISASYDFLFNPVVSIRMIEHDERSLNQLVPQRVEDRTNKLVSGLQKIPSFLKAYKWRANFLFSFEYCLVALYYATPNKRKASRYLLKALGCFFPVCFTLRFWAALKNIIIH